MYKSLTLFFVALLLINLEGLAQEKIYFGQTEIGLLVGRGVAQWDGNHENRTDLTLMSFHGARISRNHVVGFSVGLDQYDGVPILPFAFGYRGFLGKEGKPKLFGGVDLGYGSAILEEKVKNEWSESWYRGGLLFSPSVGVSFPARKGNTALTFSIAYRRQDFSYFQGNLAGTGAQTIVSDQLPPGFISLNETEHLYRSMVFRVGIMY
ncbi:hypothetical protein SAMN04489724_2414 [Algoriphagus locisalis]|uniref:Outer membrane protein beta-barrel domain-containing protein n=1 Tax=Algoriphagus locisalis TaxID=305507 RepID=A0A1I7BGV2_9BACT|nr:hypothetical protein [Algoriphagus locisalis]SFT86415.1 hypothetical protein SAMN04489724_2414 [Algoriphagus locisalis]